MRKFLIIVAIFPSLTLLGCHTETIGQAPGDEMNSKMTVAQKTANAEHKKRAEDGPNAAAPPPQQQVAPDDRTSRE
ncbi:MAG TPA: hypothetical protein VKT78_06220 [Fimbriimonadaceae bacterium]|nr:hypothetical protein [Fimbriimonadaceae bacterium]